MTGMDRPAVAPEVWAGRITPLVLTLNESPNITRCLERLTWAARVVVLDCGSTDDTVALARRFPNVDVQARAFDDFAAQRNHGLGLITTPWVLSLDADHIIPVEFLSSVGSADVGDDVDAIVARFRYLVLGRALRASLYPARPVLFRRDRCHYVADGHAETLVYSGRSASTSAAIDHDDRKPFDRWRASQVTYARLEAEKLATTPVTDLNWPDRLRKALVLGPIGVCFYTLIIKGTALDGWPGWVYAYQRLVAELMLSRQLLRRWLR
jgi:glycosyltransferase involved in cell wall biosynthesis